MWTPARLRASLVFLLFFCFVIIISSSRESLALDLVEELAAVARVCADVRVRASSSRLDWTSSTLQGTRTIDYVHMYMYYVHVCTM